MQIVQSYNKDFISEVALQCGDSQYNDFNENIYAQCAYRAQREIAKEYQIFEKVISFVTETDTWEPLPLKNFKAEYKVLKETTQLVKDKNLTERTWTEDPEVYDIKYDEVESWVINYSAKAAGDTITIYYTSTGPDASETDGTPIIPDKYYEDMLNRAVINLCKLGIAKYTGEKKLKYQDIYRINVRQKHDTGLTKDNSWIQIKPFRYP